MIRKVLATSLLLFAVIYAETSMADASVDNLESSRIEKLESAVAKVINKAGIHIDGEFRSQFLYSVVDGRDGGASSNYDSTRRSDEGVEYTSVDFDITARPHSAASGRVMFRLHQDWRNFFGALKSPISARWISMDGTIAHMFRYNVGDFKQKYSPLFMWSPDIEIDFEPELFAKYRRMAMSEDFLGNNERMLQGINLNFDAEVDPAFDEWHMNVMGARLRSSGVRPEKGGNAIIGEFDASKFDKYVLGINTDFVVVPDIEFGATFMNIWEDKKSYSGGQITSSAHAEALRERIFVTGGRLKLGTANFLDPKGFNINANGEVAISIDDSTYLEDSSLKRENVVGLAMRTGIDLSASEGMVKFSADFIRNEEDYKNEMAQSPTFIGNSRIMNVENDHATVDSSSLYSTFDALYRHVYKFTPSKDLGKASNGFFKVPVRKVAYTNSILNQEEMDTLNLYDESFNIVMPLGAATKNRTGGDFDLDFEFLEKAILLKGDFSIFSTLDGTLKNVNGTDTSYNQQMFIEYGGGASFDIGKIGDWWKYPFVISGGYKGSLKSNDAVSVSVPGWQDVSTQFVNAGLYFTFWKRASLLGGFQMLNSTVNVAGQRNVEFKQKHWGAGLEWKVTENGTLTGSFGQIFLDRRIGDDAGDYTQDSKDKYNQTDLYLTVNF